MDFSITNEEIEALRTYKEHNYEAMNQLLVSNCETDIALLSDEIESKVITLSYDKESVITNLAMIKTIYELMQKVYYNRGKREGWALARGTNMAEIERLKNEPYIDKFLSTTADYKRAENEFSTVWQSPAVMYICGEANIPYIVVDDILGKKNENQEMIIAPFTRIKEIKEYKEIEMPNHVKTLRTYNVSLEKQELEQLSEEERNGLYQYIIEHADDIDKRLQECIILEKENRIHYENIRKLEQLLAKYEIHSETMEEEGNPSQRQADLDDIERITKQLDELKEIASALFRVRKNHMDVITNWKKNIAVYMMAECREIEIKYEAEAKILEEKRQEKLKKYEEEAKIKYEMVKNETMDALLENVKQECKENVQAVEKLLENIKNLISKQQNHAKIAGNVGATYSALNNGFEMKKIAEMLQELLQRIALKVETLCEQEDKTLVEEKLNDIAKVNLQISTLINYLNNPKIATKNSHITRFDEMAIIEENELKRGIAERIRYIQGEAELKKLKDDLEMIDEKGAFSKFFGIFTGRNKLDECMIEQIEIRQKSIRRTLARRLSLVHNYSIHEWIAQIKMFINENNDDALVEEDIAELETLQEELKRNFVILDSKVDMIVEQKEGRNLPYEKKRMNKRELIEIETYRFLNKYGYDIQERDTEQNEPAYQDTMANEIARIVDYINSSNILEETDTLRKEA